MSVAAVLALWFGFVHFGERGRIGKCTRNLEELGEAIQTYANDHNDGIPAAGIDLERKKISWDTDLAPYLNSGRAKARSVYDQRQVLVGACSWFFCPSDSAQRAQPRTYAMSGRDMTQGWPPSPDDKKGVGLFWETRTVLALLDSETAQSVMENPELLPKLRRAVMAAPADTLLLTELPASDNNLGSLSRTRVAGVRAQQEVLGSGSPGFHYGRFNYLMADGHVELLTGLATGGIGETPAGIWTIKAGD